MHHLFELVDILGPEIFLPDPGQFNGVLAGAVECGELKAITRQIGQITRREQEDYEDSNAAKERKIEKVRGGQLIKLHFRLLFSIPVSCVRFGQLFLGRGPNDIESGGAQSENCSVVANHDRRVAGERYRIQIACRPAVTRRPGFAFVFRNHNVPVISGNDRDDAITVTDYLDGPEMIADFAGGVFPRAAPVGREPNGAAPSDGDGDLPVAAQCDGIEVGRSAFVVVHVNPVSLIVRLLV